MSRYDRRTTTFSPEGRLFQVEYSLESISKAGFTCGIKVNEGIILLGEKKSQTKLLDEMDSKKFRQIDDHIVVVVAGLVSDANLLINYSRRLATHYTEEFGELCSVEYVCRRLGDMMQQNTQSGGLRPYGAFLLFAGYTDEKGFQLFGVDPSGNYTEYRAHSCGQSASSAISMLKKEENIDGLNLEDGLTLAAKIAKSCTDIGSSSEKIEISTLTLVEGQPTYSTLQRERVQALLDSVEAIEET